jgi:cellobiose-specific phosphotransferase system component IIA
LPVSSGEKLCPICDSPLQPGSKKCGFCGTDLSIFETEEARPEPAKKAPPPPAPKPSIESRVREVLYTPPKPALTPAPRPEPVKEPPPVAAPPTPAPVADLKPAPQAEAEAQKETEPAAEAHEYFACPECGANVDVRASSCPGCGVMFADEGAEMFQCPACNTLVNIDSSACPGCGAVFVESEEEAMAREPPAETHAEMEAPISEVKPHPKGAPVARTPEPEPVQAAVQSPEPALVEEPAAKKGMGGFGWFKKKKKEAERPAEPEAAPVHVQPMPQPTPREAPRWAPEPEPEMRAPSPAPSAPPRPEPAQTDSKDRAKELARKAAEMGPLRKLAHDKDIDISESNRLINEAFEAGRDRQVDKALELVNRSRSILMAKIDEHLVSSISQLKEEAGVAKALGGDVSRALTYISEIEKAKTVGDAEAAFVYVDRVSNELFPITGRYKEARNRTATLRSLVTDCETLILDTKEARTALTEASKAFETNDFDRVEMLVKQAMDRLYRAIPDRVNEEMHAAKAQLIEAKMKNVNTTPMITTLKSVRTLMKSGDYSQALKEMKDFKEQMRKVM